MRPERNNATGLATERVGATDHFGPTIEYLTSLEDEHTDLCMLRGTVPPGVSVPLHAHADIEDFLILSGSMEGLRYNGRGYTWVVAQTGDYVHVPGSARHAWRNRSSEPAVSLIITSRRMGRFFQETGRPLSEASRPPTSEELARFAAASASYGHWLATPEENAAVGIEIPGGGAQVGPGKRGDEAMIAQTGLTIFRPTAEKPAYWLADHRMTPLISGEQTNSAYAALEVFVVPGGGPPPHIHHAESELFYVLEGDLTIRAGDQAVRGGPGACVHVPSGTVHTFKNEGSTPARMLVVYEPAGFEQYFSAVGTPTVHGDETMPQLTQEMLERFQAYAAQFNLEILPPDHG